MGGKTAVSDRYNDLNHKSEFRAVQDVVPACSSGLRAGLRAKCHYNYEQSFEVLTLVARFYYKAIRLQLRLISGGIKIRHSHSIRLFSVAMNACSLWDS